MQLIQRKEINIEKWDTLIDNAHNGQVYGYSWYLDIVAPNWQALVYGDYEIVLPVPTNRKKVIEQVYHPLFNQTFDFYSLKPHNKGLQLLNYLEAHFKLINIKIKTPIEAPQWFVEKRHNLILPLDNSIEMITSNYSVNLKKKLKVCAKKKLHENVYVTPSSVVAMYTKEVGGKIDSYTPALTKIIEQLIIACLRHGKGFLMGIDHGKDNVVASGFFINSHNRIINLYSSSTAEGNKVNAIAFMLNKIIEDNADSKCTFDFEGSQIQGIYDYFKRFGAQEEYYYQYKQNNLPGIIKKLF